MEKERVLLGMSGGIDSSYTAHLLLEMGYAVEGAVLKMSEYTDVAGAIKAAEALRIPLHIVDCTERFQKNVIDHFIAEYRAARTPNPCVVCNPTVKFAALCETAKKEGIPKIATGHYAAVHQDEVTGRYYLSKAGDGRKDQTYALWRLTQEQLSMLLLPLWNRQKTDVKEAVRELDLPCAGMAESQEICFIPDNDYVSYIENAAGRFPEGDFTDADGHVLGRHKGLIRYTVGQRKGLGIALGRPMFVSRLDLKKNTVTLTDEDALFRDSLTCSDICFMGLAPAEFTDMAFDVKIRYAAEPVPALVTVEKGRAFVKFQRPVRAVTPGQSAVFYRNGGVMLGGIIE